MRRLLRWLGLIAFALAAYAVCLVITAPASVVWRYIDEDVPVRLQGISGGLLAGEATTAQWGEAQAIDDLRWAFQPAGLLTGRAATRITGRLDSGRVEGTVRYAPWGGPEFRNLRLDASLEDVLTRLGYQRVAGLVSGELAADLASVSLDGKRLTAARGVIQWRQARLRLGDNFRFGDVSLRLGPQAEGAGTQGELSSRGGDIELAGELTWSPDQSLALDARIGDADEPTQASRRLRSLLGIDQGADGRLRVKGVWRDGDLELQRRP